jgi:quinol monooxygenase YgiN
LTRSTVAPHDEVPHGNQLSTPEERRMKFVQIIEYKTSRIDEVDKLTDEYVKNTEGKRSNGHAMRTKDRDNPGTYLEIVEFESYDAAMRNNDLPETQDFASKMMAICDGEPIFRNLDVQREDD